MAGINKVTPSRAIRPVKPGNKNKTEKKSNKQDKRPVSKDTSIDTNLPTKHIDEMI